MGRKKLNLTDEERILRKKEQMQRVYERQKLLKKRRVENLKPEQLEKKRSRDRIENLSPEQLEKLRTRRRIENLKPEQLEKKRMHNIKYYENLKNKRLKLMLGLYEARPQVEYLDEIDVSNPGILIKREKSDEVESTYVSNTGIFIKEEKIDEIEEEEKDKTVPIVDIKEEKGSVFLWDGLIPEPGEETFVQDDGGLSYVKQEEEMIIPDHVSTVGIKHEEGPIFYCGTQEEEYLKSSAFKFCETYMILKHIKVYIDITSVIKIVRAVFENIVKRFKMYISNVDQILPTIRPDDDPKWGIETLSQ